MSSSLQRCWSGFLKIVRANLTNAKVRYISLLHDSAGRLYDLSKADALATLTCASVPDQDKLEGWYTFGRCLPWQSLQENAITQFQVASTTISDYNWQLVLPQ